MFIKKAVGKKNQLVSRKHDGFRLVKITQSHKNYIITQKLYLNEVIIFV